MKKITVFIFCLMALYTQAQNTFPATGNVGIGTLAPENSEGWDRVLEITGSNHAKALVSSSNVKAGIWSHNTGFYGAPAGGMTGTWSNHPFSIMTNRSARLTVSASGNIGIGTSDPENSEGWDRAFEIAGTNHAKSLVSSSNVKSGLWSHNTGCYGAPAGGITGTWSNHPFSIMTNRSARLTVSASGNVGIGTTNPTQKLSVNGTIQAKEIIVNTGWSDFVFDNNYKLRPLTEVEQFVKTNKHLPEIPSQKEVEKNGVQLGDISSKLLMKIEELTLYMIDMKKENAAMSNRMKLLEKENALLKISIINNKK